MREGAGQGGVSVREGAGQGEGSVREGAGQGEATCWPALSCGRSSICVLRTSAGKPIFTRRTGWSRVFCTTRKTQCAPMKATGCTWAPRGVGQWSAAVVMGSIRGANAIACAQKHKSTHAHTHLHTEAVDKRHGESAADFRAEHGLGVV